MPVREYAGRQIDVNDEGFLVRSEQWTPEVGEAIAREVGLAALTPEHWKVLTFCREDAAREGQPPGLRRISKLSGVETKALYALFPKGPGKLAARISGLPKPQGCV
jgi:dissimilatory sulfite reductase related protein